VLGIDFWEFVVIGVVALVVLGPERLPRVARTAGHLLGRFQRYVADVKAEINREMELAELKKLQSSVEDAARSIESTVRNEMHDAQKEFREAETALSQADEELKKTTEEFRKATAEIPMPHMGTGPRLLSEPATTAESLGKPAETAEAGTHGGALERSSEAAASGTKEPSADEVDAPSPQLELGFERTAQKQS